MPDGFNYNIYFECNIDFLQFYNRISQIHNTNRYEYFYNYSMKIFNIYNRSEQNILFSHGNILFI